MPLSGHPLPDIKVSFADVFKSSKTLREEAAAAALKTHERRVSFSEPIVTPDNDGARDADSSKKVLYLDEAFTLEDVILLNQIAARRRQETFATHISGTKEKVYHWFNLLRVNGSDSRNCSSLFVTTVDWSGVSGLERSSFVKQHLAL
ncbi:hypothetical protein CIHG_09516 [Coccidioides immitis H538.4]|uniref:Uncharacterized protein n=1 Tax=Coccidioides immitis H538.4 TaxID=396776 RepID=A0A0J8S5U0_COCIT|nr:hypothetical protein CIHG_09516 [Coccidioides immitis H538.4]